MAQHSARVFPYPNLAPGLMTQLKRREALRWGLFACASLLAGCGGTEALDPDSAGPQAPSPTPTPAPTPTPSPAPAPSPSPAPSPTPTPSPAPAPTPTPAPAPAPAPTPPPAVPQAWNVNPWPFFVTGSGTSFDLATTLPVGIVRGGAFGVASSGSPLPAGMTLSSAGVLAVGSAVVSQAVGVVFTYTEPA